MNPSKLICAATASSFEMARRAVKLCPTRFTSVAVLNQPELPGMKCPFTLPSTLFRSMLETLKLPLLSPQSAERTEPERVMFVEVWENDIVIEWWVGSVEV